MCKEFCDHGEGLRPILCGLAHVAPFDQWPAFAAYRRWGYPAGFPPIIVAEHGVGHRGNIKWLGVVALPGHSDRQRIRPENFSVNPDVLMSAWRAACGLLGGAAFGPLAALWLLAGRHSGPRWRAIVLDFLWLTAFSILVLLLTRDPGSRLVVIFEALVIVWATALIMNSAEAMFACWVGWRQARTWGALLKRSQVRFRLPEPMVVIGNSLGVSLCLSLMIAVFRAKPLAGPSFLRNILRQLRKARRRWSATGNVTSFGWIGPVAIKPKFEAALAHPMIEHLITPWQSGARQTVVDEMAADTRKQSSAQPAAAQIGYAGENARLRSHRCWHIAQAVLIAGGGWSGVQLLRTTAIVSFTLVMFLALPDLFCAINPPPRPDIVFPSGRGPLNRLFWVTLATDRPRCFCVRLDSGYWAYRQADVKWERGQPASNRAEIPLYQRKNPTSADPSDGVIRIQHRNRLFFKNYLMEGNDGIYPLASIEARGGTFTTSRSK